MKVSLVEGSHWDVFWGFGAGAFLTAGLLGLLLFHDAWYLVIGDLLFGTYCFQKGVVKISREKETKQE